MTMLPLPKGVTELLFDGNPISPNCVSFAVRIFPETEAVLVYTSLSSAPIRCSGALTRLTVMANSGRIYVQRLSEYSHFEITIAPRIEAGAAITSLRAESSPPAPQGNQAKNGFHNAKRPRALSETIRRTRSAGEGESRNGPVAAAFEGVSHQRSGNSKRSEKN